ncbi:MAG TPA: NAD(P)/FAD-dependent oxidoreductase, partial [Tepidisphaeraceae bacterium]|nr:NAD(P)/FAD-dependent oxidoreductase [Tepidisphaeraceae bacterium]
MKSDAIVIGSGPNGLSAGIALARARVRVTVLERNQTIGGGCRSAALTLPGFVHDRCSTVQALACASPFFRQLPLEECGVRMAHPEIPLAHPLDDGSAAICARSVDDTARMLGPDAEAYRNLMTPVVGQWDRLAPMILAPLPRLPAHPIVLARFGLRGIRSADALAKGAFAGERARALFAGAAAHSVLPLDWAGSAAYGMVLLGSAHAVGWPVVEGGSQRLADAL